MKTATLLILLALASASPACSAPRTHQLAPGHAECVVCASEGDLACLDVKIAADTPRTEWNGRSFYFCSDECRQRFEREPQRFTKP